MMTVVMRMELGMLMMMTGVDDETFWCDHDGVENPIYIKRLLLKPLVRRKLIKWPCHRNEET